MNQELYTSICNAKIKESIFLSSKIILKDPDKNFGIILNTFISILSYIGSFISIYEIRLWIDVSKNINEFIENDKIVMKDIYIIITKLCILCDIYIKHPSLKTGTTNIKLLRTKVIDIFEGIDFKLTDSGVSIFEGILPPINSPTYNISTQIITGYVFIMKKLDGMSVDNDVDKISDIADKIRNSFDYIIRKKYVFETKFYESDNDAVWFLWGFISLLYQDQDFDMIYSLFNNGYSKKTKSSRIGLLWVAALLMVYIKKKDIARNWNNKELHVIKKIEEVSIDLYKDIKKELIANNEIEDVPKKSMDGLEYIYGLRHNINTKKENINIPETEAVVKLIKYKR